MKRPPYPDCPGAANCLARRRGGRAACHYCQSAAPFGFPPAGCQQLDRLRFGRL